VVGPFDDCSSSPEGVRVDRRGMGYFIKLLALVVGFFALVFLFVGLLWTEWPQTLVGLALAIAAVIVWTAGDRAVARSQG
jgi:hypothetical protein